jgi:hypothetical protein
MERFVHNTADALAKLAIARTTSDHATVAQLMVATSNTSALTTQLET